MEANKDVVQNKTNNSKYYTGMHGWIYKKLKGTKFDDLHSKKEFKPFCFGNLYPIKKEEIKEGNIYKVWVSSPDENFIQTIFFNISEGEHINLGEYSFTLDNYKVIESEKIRPFSILESPTFINVTKSKKGGYKALNFLEEKEEFLEKLKINLIRKYNQFKEGDVDMKYDLFKNCLVEAKENSFVSVEMNIYKDDEKHNFKVIGNQLRFKLGAISKLQNKIFHLGYEVGFGERNTYGMGFMIKTKSSNINDLDS